MSELERVKASEVLILAKDKIIDGWVPHAPERSGEVCAYTAIDKAFIDLNGVGIYRAVAKSCLLSVIPTGNTVSQWNDSGPKQKVIDGFDAAIRLAKEREQS